MAEVRIIPVAAIKKCPAFILLPDHYRTDNTCRCDEPTCEWESCSSPKLEPEIYCKDHFIQVCGEEYFREVYGE